MLGIRNCFKLILTSEDIFNPVDNEKSLKQLNYRSKVTFYEAMHTIIEYYKNQSS